MQPGLIVFFGCADTKVTSVRDDDGGVAGEAEAHEIHKFFGNNVVCQNRINTAIVGGLFRTVKHRGHGGLQHAVGIQVADLYLGDVRVKRFVVDCAVVLNLTCGNYFLFITLRIITIGNKRLVEHHMAIECRHSIAVVLCRPAEGDGAIAIVGCERSSNPHLAAVDVRIACYLGVVCG